MRVLFSSPRLSKLELEFQRRGRERWHGIFEASSLSLLDVLHQPIPSAQLKRISLCNVPLRAAEIRKLDAILKNDLDTLNTDKDNYFAGSWDGVPHVVRAFKKLDGYENSK
jgi:hypothetical protein